MNPASKVFENLRGEGKGEKQENTTSFWVDKKHYVSLQLSFHGEGKGEGWYTICITPKEGSRGVPPGPTKEKKYSLADLLRLIKEARAAGKSYVTFSCTFRGRKKKKAHGEFPIREIMHRIGNAAVTIEKRHPLYNQYQEVIRRDRARKDD